MNGDFMCLGTNESDLYRAELLAELLTLKQED